MELIERLIRGYVLAVRLVSAGLGILGIVLLWLAYPPGGSDAIIPFFIGGVFVLLGVVGIFKPVAVLPSGGRHDG